jgi:hypothetical protein
VPLAPWLDGIIDGSGVLLLLLSVPLPLLPSVLLLSDVVTGGGEVLLLLLPSLLVPSLLALPSVVSCLELDELVVLLLSSTTVGGGVGVVSGFLSDACLFSTELCEDIMDGGEHSPFIGIEPSGHGRDREDLTAKSLLPLSVLLDVVD